MARENRFVFQVILIIGRGRRIVWTEKTIDGPSVLNYVRGYTAIFFGWMVHVGLLIQKPFSWKMMVMACKMEWLSSIDVTEIYRNAYNIYTTSSNALCEPI